MPVLIPQVTLYKHTQQVADQADSPYPEEEIAYWVDVRGDGQHGDPDEKCSGEQKQQSLADVLPACLQPHGRRDGGSRHLRTDGHLKGQTSVEDGTVFST